MSSVIAGSFSNANTTQKMQGNTAVDLRNAQVTDINAQPPLDKQQAEPEVKTPVNAEQLGEAVKSINEFVSAEMRTLNFSIDENSGKAVVKVIDFETKDVIRQIPGDEVLRMASAIKRLQEDLGSATGLLIDNKV